MGSYAANAILVGDVLTDDGGTVELVRAADVLAKEPAGTTVFRIKTAVGDPWYRSAFYPNAQLVKLSNR